MSYIKSQEHEFLILNSEKVKDAKAMIDSYLNDEFSEETLLTDSEMIQFNSLLKTYSEALESSILAQMYTYLTFGKNAIYTEHNLEPSEVVKHLECDKEEGEGHE